MPYLTLLLHVRSLCLIQWQQDIMTASNDDACAVLHTCRGGQPLWAPFVSKT